MVGEHVVVGKEMLKCGSIFESLPDFPSNKCNYKKSNIYFLETSHQCHGIDFASISSSD
jgi:hypothetical protein